NEGLLEELLADPFFQAEPPRSTGRERFGDAYASRLREIGEQLGLSLEDLLATAAELTAVTVADAIGRFLSPGGVDAVYVSGGGVRNATLMVALRRRLDGLTVKKLDELGVAAESKEALAFALLAHLTLSGEVVVASTNPRHAAAVSYLDVDHVASVTWHDGRAVHYDYDARGNLAAVTDEGGRVTSLTWDYTADPRWADWLRSKRRMANR
ncbi:MAG: anhydro-N-acetylmuramic acid kinase, partial [Armatimonadetes bacterium]|nr:anhydro-N-acetylmuramic acid kinase [Armatimonadota bacterium]